MHHPDSATRDDLLLEMARRGRGEESILSSRFRAILDDPERRTDFFVLAGRHYLHGLVLARLAALAPTRRQDAALRDLAHDSLRRLRAEARIWDLERDRLIRVLEERGLGPLVLKGAALRLTTYAEPAHRPIGDLDILVPRDDVTPARETLGRMGYHIPYSADQIRALEQQHFHLRFKREPFVLELHWELNSAQAPYRLDPASFLSRSRIRSRPGMTDIRVPSPEDMVLHMVAQNVDSQTRLGRLVDIDRVIETAREFDWEYLRDTAGAAGLLIMLAVDLRLCRTLLETTLPPEYVARLEVPRLNRWHMALMRPTTWPFADESQRPAAHQLKRLWGRIECRERFDWVRGVLSDRRDPLVWIWDEDKQARGRSAPSLRHGITVFLKLIVYQCWLYARGAGLLLTRSGRRELTFFSD